MLRQTGVLAIIWLCAAHAQGVVLEGTGHAVILNDDVDTARLAARQSAMRDVALKYEARINSSDTLENGVLTESRLTVAASARARNVSVIDEQRTGNLLRVTIRADMSQEQGCTSEGAPALKKRVAITGFPVLYPEQAQLGGLDNAGEVLPRQIQQHLLRNGQVQVLGAARVQLFDNLFDAPTQQGFDNRLTNVVELSRQLDAQFVVSGVIRSLAVADPAAWGTSLLDRMQRGIGMANRKRRFVADMMIYDGFSGSPVYQQRFATDGNWNAAPGLADGFAGGGFAGTDYGKAVAALVEQMAASVTEALACQPFMTRVTRVEGNRVTIAAGATAGFRPGQKLNLYRSYSHFDAPGATPELQDTGLSMTLNNVHPEFSNGTIPEHGGTVNIQRNDIAISW
ncbi:hypothetical protein BG841_03110 [Marinobacter sp. X15-166B]|nr:hypothetical protein BG841_03110 [Marinobacter sp. X15-166B]